MNQKAQTRVINLEDQEADLVDVMLRYIYSGGILIFSRFGHHRGEQKKGPSLYSARTNGSGCSRTALSSNLS